MCRGDEVESSVQGSNSGQSPPLGFASPTAAAPASGVAAAIDPGFEAGSLASPKGIPAVDQFDHARQQVPLPAPVIMYCMQQEEGSMLCWQADPQQPPLQLVQVPASQGQLPRHQPLQAQDLLDMNRQPETIHGYDSDECLAQGEAKGLESERTTATQVNFPTVRTMDTGVYQVFGLVSHVGQSRTGGHYDAAVQSAHDDARYECNDEQAASPSRPQQPVYTSEHASLSGDDISELAAMDMPLSDALRASGHRRRQAIDILRTSMLRKCFEHDGCREVQLAFEVLDSPVVLSELLTSLHGSSVSLSKSPYGNYVLQKVIEVMPPTQVGFILQELRGHVVGISKHRYACRILCRLLEHCGSEPGVGDIVDELMTQAHELCRHPFAHHVIESVVEHGLPQHRHQSFTALCADLQRNAADRHSSFVVEAALRCCSAADQQALAQALLGAEGSSDCLTALAQTRFGSHVVRSLLKFPGTSATTASRLREDVRMLWATRHGRRLLKDVGMAPDEALAAVAVAA